MRIYDALRGITMLRLEVSESLRTLVNAMRADGKTIDKVLREATRITAKSTNVDTAKAGGTDILKHINMQTAEMENMKKLAAAC